MSETLASLGHKIEGADKLKSVVRAMKGMAAASIGQYESAVRALAVYESALAQALGACFRQPQHQAPYASSPAPSKVAGVGAIVFGSDQGLVGQFNEVLSEFAVATLNAIPGPKIIWAVGQRVEGNLSAAGFTPTGTFAMPTSVTAITRLVGDIQIASQSRRAQGDYSQLHLFHNRPQPGAQYEPATQRLLPLDADWQNSLAKIPWPTRTIPEFLGGLDLTLQALIREYLFISLYKACAESLASENAARLAAMQRAEKNIQTLTADLRQSFHRLRQSSIDEELFDVIAAS